MRNDAASAAADGAGKVSRRVDSVTRRDGADQPPAPPNPISSPGPCDNPTTTGVKFLIAPPLNDRHKHPDLLQNFVKLLFSVVVKIVADPVIGVVLGG